MTKPYQILIAEPDDFSPQAVSILKRVGEVKLQTTTAAELHYAFQNYDVVWFRLATRITEELLGSSPRCQILAAPVTGVDHIDLAACEVRGIRVVSLRGEVEFLRNVRATAELNLGLAIAVMRHIPSADQSVKQGHWNRDLFRGNELFGKTAGIVGVGRLGSILSRYLAALGMTVFGFDPNSDFSDSAAVRIDSLEQLLASSDVVFLLVNYDRATHHLIGQREFAEMRKGAFLINTSRGGVVDERAMLAALREGRLAGAALDVLDGEPQITDSHELVVYAKSNSNLLIVPHIGGNTFESFEKTEVFLAQRVAEHLSRLNYHTN